MYSFTEENYLKAIYKLQERNEDAVNTNSIAASLETKAASVTDMIKKLSAKDLLVYEKYKGVQLTALGKRIAIDTVRKHRLWETFLVEKLKFSWDEVHELAEELEHIQSEKLIDKLDEFLGFPAHDPHGDPIPQRDGVIKQRSLFLLSELIDGQKGIVSGVVDHSSVFLQYLEKMNLVLGKQIFVSEQNQFDKSYQIVLNETDNLHISVEVAKNVLVRLI